MGRGRGAGCGVLEVLHGRVEGSARRAADWALKGKGRKGTPKPLTLGLPEGAEGR